MANKHSDALRCRIRAQRNFFAVWRRLLRYCGVGKGALSVALVALVLYTACTMYTPFLMAALTDLFTANGVENGADAAAFARVAVQLLLLFLAGAALSMLGRWLMSGLSQHASHHIRRKISEKINRLPTSACEGTGVGDLLSRLINDMDTVGHALHEALADLLPALLLFFGSLFMMLLTEPLLAAVAVFATAIGLAAMFLVMKASQKHFRRQQEALGGLNNHVQEAYNGREAIHAANAGESVFARFRHLNKVLERSVFRAALFSDFLTPIMAFTGNLGYVAVCVSGAAMVLEGRISFGVVIAFMLFVHNFTHPFTEISNAMQGLQSAAAAGERVFAFLDAPELATGGESFSGAVRGEIVFDHVSFRYPEATHDALCDVSFSVKPGERVAIVGASGSGKSTVADLLTGLRLPDVGEVRIDGIPTSKLSAAALHPLFAPVFRNAWVFEGTVRENLMYCAEHVSEREMREAARAVGIDHFIRTLPRGYDTAMGEEHIFSKGQIQQLEIARALLSGHPILILDEATEAIDPRHVLMIDKALERLTRGRTSFVMTKRRSELQAADLVIFLCDGRIAAQGTHDELVLNSNEYAALWYSATASE